MSSSIFDKLDSFFDFCETAKGKLFLAIIISFSYIAYSLNNPVGIMPPGIYYFGVIISTGLFLWSASLQESKSTKIVTIVLGVLFVIWAIANTIMRN